MRSRGDSVQALFKPYYVLYIRVDTGELYTLVHARLREDGSNVYWLRADDSSVLLPLSKEEARITLWRLRQMTADQMRASLKLSGYVGSMHAPKIEIRMVTHKLAAITGAHLGLRSNR